MIRRTGPSFDRPTTIAAEVPHVRHAHEWHQVCSQSDERSLMRDKHISSYLPIAKVVMVNAPG